MSGDESTTRSESQEDISMNAHESKAGSQQRDVDRTRRALLHAGWIVPAVIALKLPTNAFAQYSAPYSASATVTTPVVSAGVGVTVTPPPLP
jgi:hypothetical protein